MVTVKLQAVDQATLQMFETPQFLQPFSIDSADFPCRDPAISSPIFSMVKTFAVYCNYSIFWLTLLTYG